MCENKSNNKSSEELKNDLWRTLLCAGLAVFAIWLLSWILIDVFIADSDRGTFGDKFGAINALFSGLAFAGLIVTLLYQKEELKLQREELAQTREELKGQREEFEEQNKTMKRQRFENTFFNMLSLQQEITHNLSYENPIQDEAELVWYGAKQRIYKSRDVFEGLYTNAIIDYGGSRCCGGIKDKLANHGYAAYSQIKGLSFLDHYFRHLYRIVKYVDTSDSIAEEERYDYACIVRSQLSDYELVMLFYSGITAGRDKFKPLIEKYSILNNLRHELLANPEHKDEYAKDAYDRSAE